MKILCPYCDEIIDVDDGALSTSCPHCQKEIETEPAKIKTAQRFKQYQNSAYNNMYMNFDYESAWIDYQNCLLLKENDLNSIIGLCLAKTSMATFDKTYFEEVEKIIDQYEIYLNLENTFLFLNFIGDMLDQINFYYSEASQRIVKDKTFISKEYFDEYVRTTKEVQKLLKFFEDSYELMDQKELENFKKEHENIFARFEGRKTDIEGRLNSVYNVNHIGDVKVTNGEVEILGDNKVDIDIDKLENPSIVVINKQGLSLRKIFFPLMGVFGALTLALLISYLSTKNNILGYVAIGTLAITGALFATYKILFKKTRE